MVSKYLHSYYPYTYLVGRLGTRSFSAKGGRAKRNHNFEVISDDDLYLNCCLKIRIKFSEIKLNTYDRSLTIPCF